MSWVYAQSRPRQTLIRVPVVGTAEIVWNVDVIVQPIYPKWEPRPISFPMNAIEKTAVPSRRKGDAKFTTASSRSSRQAGALALGTECRRNLPVKFLGIGGAAGKPEATKVRHQHPQ